MDNPTKKESLTDYVMKREEVHSKFLNRILDYAGLMNDPALLTICQEYINNLRMTNLYDKETKEDSNRA